MDTFEQVCPRCKTTSYRNPSLKLMVNVCGHALCDSCVELLFIRGSGNCPDCKIPLRKNNFRIQLFEDPYIEKELDIRRRILKDYNKREQDFPSLRQWNDYLEEVETIIFNLANDIDVDNTKRKIDQYKKDNKDYILKNKSKQSAQDIELSRMVEEEALRSALRQEEIKKEEVEEKKRKIKNKEALIDELMFSDIDASQIIATHKKTVNVEEVKPVVKLTSGVTMGRKGAQPFLPVPKAVDVPLYSYAPQTLVIDGPKVPDINSYGYMENIRAADASERAGGYVESSSCLRALQEAMAGIFFVPRKNTEEEMDVT